MRPCSLSERNPVVNYGSVIPYIHLEPLPASIYCLRMALGEAPHRLGYSSRGARLGTRRALGRLSHIALEYMYDIKRGAVRFLFHSAYVQGQPWRHLNIYDRLRAGSIDSVGFIHDRSLALLVAYSAIISVVELLAKEEGKCWEMPQARIFRGSSTACDGHMRQ
jgi:hypothetical protein